MNSLPKRDEMVAVLDNLSGQHLKGKGRALRLCLMALLTGGHILLEDIPGLGKTTMALAFASSLGLSFGRVQCTSDLLPSDITGLSIFDRVEGRFTFIKGPIFNNIVLIDEINRAMPKTQSALLEAMEERRVTVEGVTYQLPDPFLVLATQNPVEQVGTYPLPESQMDRFIMKTGIGYPPEEIEKGILMHGSDPGRDPAYPRHGDARGPADGDCGGTKGGLPGREGNRLRLRHHQGDPQSPADPDRHVDPRRHRAGRCRQGRRLPARKVVRSPRGRAGRWRSVVCAHRLIFRPEQEGVDKEQILNAYSKRLPLPLI